MADWIGDDNDNVHGGTGEDDKIEGRGGNDALSGGAGKDHIKGEDGDDVLRGGAGNDNLDGNDGADELHGDAGNDDLDGNNGADVLYGGAGHDDLNGGNGDDRLVYVAAQNRNNQGGDEDEYNGGSGFDTLVLDFTGVTVTAEMQQEIDDFNAMNGSGGEFEFDTLNLEVKSIEALSVLSPGGPQPPMAQDDDFGTDEDTLETFDLLENDANAAGASVAIVGSNVPGGLSNNGDGTVAYDPGDAFQHLGAGESEQVTFDYTLTNGAGTSQATVTITVTGENDAPVAPAGPLVLAASDEGVPRGVFFRDLKAGITDAEGDAITFVTVVDCNVRWGANRAGVVFHPDEDDDGEVVATIRFRDEHGAMVDREVRFDLLPVNDAPEGSAAVALAASDEDARVLLTLDDLIADTIDVDGDTLEVRDLRVAANSASTGTLFDMGQGVWAFDPAANDDGAVTFSYTLHDGTVGVARTATMDLRPVNDAPVIERGAPTFAETVRGGEALTVATVTFAASDVDGDALTFRAPAVAINGAAAAPRTLEQSFDAATGTLTLAYSSDANFDLTYGLAVSDGRGGEAEAASWLQRGDWIDLAAGDARIHGSRAETILGTDAADVIRGGGGRDGLYGYDGADTLVGGAEGDVLSGGAGNDRVIAGDGDDFLLGGDGRDALWGQAGDDVLRGEAGGDVIRAGDGDDVVEGGTGSDMLLGGAGADDLRGGNGWDKLQGEDGDDVLHGDRGHDTLWGGAGDDLLVGGHGRDTLHGGAGADTFRMEGDRGYADTDVIADFERGVDRVELDVDLPVGVVAPFTRADVIATETFDGSLYTYSFADTSFSTTVRLEASDLDVI